MTSDESVIAALLLTNRITEVAAKPFAPKEFWTLIGRVPDPGVFMGSDAATVAAVLGGDDAFAERVVTLLDAAVGFAVEQERLEESGVVLLSALDERYPPSLRRRLGPIRPPFLMVAGDLDRLSAGGIGVVGSRDVSAHGGEVAVAAGARAVELGVPVVTGAARGVDQLSMKGAIDAGGSVVGIPSEGLGRMKKEIRALVHEDRLTLASPYGPNARFTAGNAMGRNKVIYALADVTLVVASDVDTGGTWQGATEALRRGFGPVAVWTGDGAGPGNAVLAERGAMVITDLARLEGGGAIDEVVSESTPEQLTFGIT